MNTLGKRLKECRAEKRVTQAVAAKAVKMSQASLSDLENGLYPTSTYTLKLSAYYGVDPHWLETGKGKKESSQNIRSETDPIIDDLAILAPEDADVWRAEIKAAADVRRAKLRAAEIKASQKQLGESDRSGIGSAADPPLEKRRTA